MTAKTQSRETCWPGSFETATHQIQCKTGSAVNKTYAETQCKKQQKTFYILYFEQTEHKEMQKHNEQRLTQCNIRYLQISGETDWFVLLVYNLHIQNVNPFALYANECVKYFSMNDLKSPVFNETWCRVITFCIICFGGGGIEMCAIKLELYKLHEWFCSRHTLLVGMKQMGRKEMK